MGMISYAVIDGAVENGLLAMLEEFDPPVSCLYAEPVQPELVVLAPYLVQVTEDVKQWLTTRDSPWGCYFMSDVDLKHFADICVNISKCLFLTRRNRFFVLRP